MKNEYLPLAIATALLIALVGIIMLTALRCPIPECLPNVAMSAIGALAMAFRGTVIGGASNGSSTTVNQ